MRGSVALAIGLSAAGCGHAASAQAKPDTQEEKAMDNGAKSPTGEPHPGKIVHEDKVDGRTWTKSASEVPQSIAWIEVDGTWVAVTRIVATGTKEQRRITSYDASGRELETTMQSPPPPPPR